MNPTDLERYNTLYEQHLTNLKLQGKRPATIDAYYRAVGRKALIIRRMALTKSEEMRRRKKRKTASWLIRLLS